MSLYKVNELARKSIHLGSLIIPLIYRYAIHYNRWLMFWILFTSLIIMLLIEMYRIQQPTFRKYFQRLFGLILRRHENSDFTGATFVIFASLLCVVFFKDIIAFLSISFLSIGDTFAAIIGISKGKRKFFSNKKTLEGSFACFVSIMIFSFFFADDLNPFIYTIGAVWATISEVWNFPVDDNVKIPMVSGLVMTLMYYIV